ncbi:L,D-transpeptidase family protein [Providencia sp. PROV152]|uniref:Murein L,D-transpeptidase n=1 Tax=Providencia stuartii TaxID=588 RepID=A0AAI9I084_PROST|nr:murein L,D-transpeptidase family protein [Providencia sp. PROV152]ELR5036036.1 murein L,D-transpeptidase [Providencia stuartii]ELR5038014.1 murein L,D-transpeptidase [Providencia stuartii]
MKKNTFISFSFILFSLQALVAEANNHSFLLNSKTINQQDSTLFIQIFKQEGILELYKKAPNGKYNLSKTYPICKFSGGLGPKKLEGDLKSPEGFYQITASQLNPNSRYYRSINLGFPNEFDRAQGYEGNYLMIHGDCVSVGCYAMTDKYMSEIYQAVETAFKNGQNTIDVSIYPFRMTKENMLLHRNSSHYAFWQQLKPAYDYFHDVGKPAQISVTSRKYAVNSLPETQDKLLRLRSQYTLAEVK